MLTRTVTIVLTEADLPDDCDVALDDLTIDEMLTLGSVHDATEVDGEGEGDDYLDF